MDENIFRIAADVLQLSEEEVKKNCKIMPEIDGAYFWQSRRGGNAVIVNAKGEKLAATSAVSFEKHLAAFIAGKRN